MKHRFPPTLGEDHVLRALRALAPKRGMRKQLAHEIGITESVLCQILNKNRPVPDHVGEKLGYRKVSRWERR